MAPMYELDNPPQIELAWPRTEDLLTNRLPQVEADAAVLQRLEQIAVFTTGFDTRAWVDLSWMLFSFWTAPTFKDLMEDLGRGSLNPAVDHTVLSRDALQRALEAMAIQFDDVPAHLRIESIREQRCSTCRRSARNRCGLCPMGWCYASIRCSLLNG